MQGLVENVEHDKHRRVKEVAQAYQQMHLQTYCSEQMLQTVDKPVQARVSTLVVMSERNVEVDVSEWAVAVQMQIH